MSATTKLVRREIERARKAGGMRAGMPKITIDAAVAERLVLEAEAQPPVTGEPEPDGCARDDSWDHRTPAEAYAEGWSDGREIGRDESHTLVTGEPEVAISRSDAQLIIDLCSECSELMHDDQIEMMGRLVAATGEGEG